MGASRREILGEALGTFLLVLLGTGTVASSVLLGRPSGLPAVAACWGVAVALAILVARRFSAAHLNPAVSVALAAWRPSDFPRAKLLPYCAAQLAGATLAGACVLALFAGPLREFEAREGIVRGAPGSERAAMVFGEYFPNPAAPPEADGAPPRVTAWEAAGAEAVATGVLVLLVFGLAGAPRLRATAPFLVGLCVAVLIVNLAPMTQCCLNPARDLGPRLVAYAAGYGAVAIPGPGGGFWVYVAGPIAGGLAAGGVARYFALAASGPRELVPPQ